MARILIVAGGCRGRRLGGRLAADGHAVRITTRTEAGRPAIEATGAECFLGTPDRIASLRYALDGVTIVCWLLGSATGADALHGARLESLLGQIIDTTVRGVVYEAAGTVPADVLAGGGRLVAARAAFNAVPYRLLVVDPADPDAWHAAAATAIGELLQD
jgi:hypothetical protein